MAQNKAWDLIFAFCVDREGHDWLDDGCAKCGIGRRYWHNVQLHFSYSEEVGTPDRVSGRGVVYRVCDECGYCGTTGETAEVAPRYGF